MVHHLSFVNSHRLAAKLARIAQSLRHHYSVRSKQIRKFVRLESRQRLIGGNGALNLSQFAHTAQHRFAINNRGNLFLC